jgi:hypothetical protein
MDVRMIDQQQQQQQQPQKSLKQQQQQQLNESNRGGLKYHQIGEQNVPSTRFNEWDPYGISKQQHLQQQFLLQQQQQQQSLSERQKSPHKSKNAANSNFAHTFLNTDSSPRQTSGRSQTGSANVQNAKLQQISPQNQQQFSSGGGGGNQNEMSSSSNLDLMVSGQKLGGRKELSPTNTPRESAQQQSPQHSQQQNSANHRPFTRRLQPLEKLNAELNANSQTSQSGNQVVQNSQNGQASEGQFLRQKT